jgi:hypothetical protein
MPLNKNEFIIKRNDTLPALQLNLIDRGCLGGKEPFNLSGITGVTFTMTRECGDYKIFAKDAQVVSYSCGTIQYNWSSEDTNEGGTFKGEFQLLYSDGNKLSVPQNGFIDIMIPKDVNPY